jgi:hypothetical protein
MLAVGIEVPVRIADLAIEEKQNVRRAPRGDGASLAAAAVRIVKLAPADCVSRVEMPARRCRRHIEDDARRCGAGDARARDRQENGAHEGAPVLERIRVDRDLLVSAKQV